MGEILEYVNERDFISENSYLNKIDKIIVYINPEIEELIPDYLTALQVNIEKIRFALKHDDYPTILRIGHNLRGEGGSYGFDLITEIGEIIESAAEERNAAEIYVQMCGLSSYLEKVEIVYK
jgi:hypothetical protein